MSNQTASIPPQLLSKTVNHDIKPQVLDQDATSGASITNLVPTDAASQTSRPSIPNDLAHNQSDIAEDLWAWPDSLHFPVFLLLTVITNFMITTSDKHNPFLPYTSFFVMSSYFAAIFIIFIRLTNTDGRQIMFRWALGLADAACLLMALALIVSTIMILKGKVWVPPVIVVAAFLIFCCLKYVERIISEKSKDLPISKLQQTTKVQLQPSNTNTLIYSQGVTIFIFGAAENIIQNPSFAEGSSMACYFLIASGLVSCISITYPLTIKRIPYLSRLIGREEIAFVSLGCLIASGISSCIQKITSKKMGHWMVVVSPVVAVCLGVFFGLIREKERESLPGEHETVDEVVLSEHETVTECKIEME